MARRKDHPFRAVFRTDPFGWTKFKSERRGFGHVGAIHKGAIAEKPYRFSNELICGSIAQFLRLPIPPFCVTEFWEQEGAKKKGELLFSSLDFNYERDSTPPPDFDLCVKHLEATCAGILLFDIFVLNPDRTRDNLWCDNPARPKRLMIYDHDAALLGCENDGIDRLKGLEDKLGLCFWLPNQQMTNWHPFLRKIESPAPFEEWYQKIATIPKWFLNETCEDATKFEISKSEAKSAARILLNRSRGLEDIVNRNRAEFTAIHDWTRGLFP
jgi:hypothetical protein